MINEIRAKISPPKGDFYMETTIIFIYFLSCEFIKAINHIEDDNCKMTDSEVITFAITSALFFQCNYKKTSLFFKSYNHFKNIFL